MAKKCAWLSTAAARSKSRNRPLAAPAMSAEESLYRCSAGFSDFLTANVLAACKSRSGPGPIGLRPSLSCALAAVLECSTWCGGTSLPVGHSFLFCGRAEEGVSQLAPLGDGSRSRVVERAD